MFKNTMVILGICAVATLCFMSYELGKSQAKVEFVIQEKEIVRHEKNCAVNILAEPNINDDAIVELFDNGLL